ncbi:MAG: FAD-dependent oxidoreductase [Patescibacteria group bacterium]
MRLPILKRRNIAHETIELMIDLRGSDFLFRPGQYVHIIIPDPKHRDDQGNARDFSIVSAPSDREKLVIAFRNSQSAFKRNLSDLPLGTELEVEGPYGGFTLPKKSDRPLVFVAGGIGITPFMSMIRHTAEEELPHRIVLLYANSNAERVAYLSELGELAGMNPNFTFAEHRGHVTSAAVVDAAGEFPSPRFFIAGPPAMVTGVRATLVNAAFSEDDVIFEEFIGYA